MSETREARLKDASEMLWVVLASVSGGDWTKQTQDWQEAAARWRDNYFAVMREFPPPEPPTPEPERPAARCVWTIVRGPLGAWVQPACEEGAIRAPWGTERAKACHLCGQPLVVEAPHA